MTDFEEPLFGCFSDLFSCIVAWVVPCGSCYIQASAVSKATEEGMLVPFIMPCLLACVGGALNRGKIRDKYKYAGSFPLDCLLHWFCTCCAVTQEYREVDRQSQAKK
jgi:Cys-rich protein (TIGR01571 family)